MSKLRELLASEKCLARHHEYEKTFSTPHGKRVLADLMEQCGMLRVSFNPKTPDIHSTIFREGMRNVILMILGEINVDQYALQEMVKLEKLQEKQKDDSSI